MRNTVIAAILLMLAGAASAQEARSGGGAGSNAALVQQLQQLASERTDLQAQNVKLQKDLADMRHERDGLKTGQAGAAKRAQQSEVAVFQIRQDAATRQKAAEENVARWKEQLDQLVAKYRELAKTLQDTETERTTLRQKLATQEHALIVCTDDNAGLYNLNTEVLTHFEHQSPFASVLRAEPFTQIARKRLENTALEYKQRAQELRAPAIDSKGAAKAGT